MRFLFQFLIAVLTLVGALLCACSTISLKQSASYPMPPAPALVAKSASPVEADQALEKQYLQNPSPHMRVLVRYQQAKIWMPVDATKSCALWEEVLGEKNFPLHDIALMQAVAVCPVSRQPPLTDSDIQSWMAVPWRKELAVRSLLSLAKVKQDKKSQLAYELASVDFEKLQSAKVTRLQTALQFATELNDSEKMALAQNMLSAVAPRFIAAPTPEQLFSVANDLRQAREFAKARQAYQGIIAQENFTDFDRLRALDGIRQTYKLEKDTERFLKATQEYAKFSRTHILTAARAGLKKYKDPSDQAVTNSLFAKYVEVQSNLARALWTENHARLAALVLQRVEKVARGHASTENCAYMRARIEEEAGRYRRALQIANAIDTTQMADTDLKAKVLWSRAWLLRSLGLHGEAATAFAQLVATELNPSLSLRDRFWLARELKITGNTEGATEQFNWLTENDPLGWYGLLAYRELAKPFEAIAPPSHLTATSLFSETVFAVRKPADVNSNQTVIPETEILTSDDKLVFEWLVATGETALAKNFLDATTGARRAHYDPQESIELLRLYARSGNYQSMFAILGELGLDARKTVAKLAPELAFPRPWNAEVSEAAEKAHVEPELIYAIMRQESAFNPTARSHADALGLMQIIPEAARRVEKQTQVKTDDFEDLYDPQKNIYVGGFLLHDLLNRWQGKFIPAVASYNASEKSIANWINQRWHGDTLAFIEDIPFEETRTYVKLVMRNYIFYQRLNSSQTSMPFPEWCLSDLHGVKP